MSRPLFTNNAATALARAITPTDTILQVTAGTGQYFPSPSIGDYFMLTLVQVNNPEVSEIVECIGRAGDILTVIRGQEGTSPQIFNISDNVELRITAGSLNLFAIGGGSGGGSASGTSVAEFTATQGQTVFTLPFSYTQGINNLAVYVNGSKQIVNVNYAESTTTTFTMANGLNAGDVVEAIYNLPLSGGIINSSNVTYNEQGTGAANRTVQAKLQESVSVKDFGAVGDGTTDDTAAIQAAHNAARYVNYPAGTYKITSSIVLPSGAFVIGQGANSGGSLTNNNTIINATTSAFAYTMDAAVGTSIEGPRFSNIQINCQNGIRLNSTTGGQPEYPGCTQGIINNASFRKVFINQNGTNGTGTGLQASVAFHLEFTEQSEVLGFQYNIDIYYSDFALISHCRIWQFGKAAIRLTPANTFGSHSIIEKNDLLYGLTGATAFIVCNDYNPTIRNNFIEQQTTQGTGLSAAIACDGNYDITIDTNVVSIPTACAPNWLVVTNTYSLNRVNICNNSLVGYPSPAASTASFNGGLGLDPYCQGGNAYTICTHYGNTTEAGIPFNSVTVADSAPTAYKQLVSLNPSVTGAIENYYGVPGNIKNNQFVLTPTTSVNTVFWSNPNNNYAGTAVDIYALVYADGAQTVFMHPCDNHANISAINPTLTTKPTWYQIGSNVTATTSLQVNFATSSTYGSYNTYIMAVVINAH